MAGGRVKKTHSLLGERKEIVLISQSYINIVRDLLLMGEDRKLTYIKLAKGTRQSLAATENRDRITEKPPSQDPGIQDLLGTEAGPGQQRTTTSRSLTMRPTSI